MTDVNKVRSWIESHDRASGDLKNARQTLKGAENGVLEAEAKLTDRRESVDFFEGEVEKFATLLRGAGVEV